MPITRTPMIDDDGSGTTGTILNNAWKQELYNQIDGLAALALPWTPTETSGAGLAFSVATGMYWLSGPMVTIWGRVIYPATSSPANAIIGGLPFINSGTFAGCHQTFGPVPAVFHLAAGANTIALFTPAGVALTNATLSGVQLIFQGAYLIA